MLDGTDLYSAFQPLGGPQNDPYASLYSQVDSNNGTSDKQIPVETKTEKQDSRQVYDANIMNQQYETEQKLSNILSEIKKKKTDQQQTDNQSYVDKLFGKKKELFKILQLALIVTLGLSLHYLIDHYLQNYLQDTDISFERQLLLRILYPLAILFILWNLKVFIK
jgi:hypothetical protein